MSVRTIGVVMNGVTGRMGYRQHLVRSILAIREQGGVALADGSRVMARAGAGRPQRREAARRSPSGTASTEWTTDLDAALADDDRRDLLRRPGHRRRASGDPAGDRGRQAHLHREADRRDLDRRARAGPAGRAPPGVKHGVVQDKLFLPGLLKLKRLIDGGFFGRILSVRGEFGYWVFEGDWQAAQRPRWNYRAEDGGGIVAGHVLPLALRAGEPLRPGRVGPALRPPPTSPSAGTSRASPTRPPPTTPRTASSSWRAASSPRSTPPGRCGSTATSWWSSRSTAPQGSAVAGLRNCRVQHRAHHAQAGVEPRPARPPSRFRDQWQEVPGQRRVRQRLQGPVGAVPARTSSTTRPSRTTSLAGARGVQLAELGLRSSAEGRRLEVPEIAL